MSAEKTIRITLVRSLVGYPQTQRVTARGLGLGKPGSSVVRLDNPSIRGMVQKIIHVVKVEEVTK